MSKIWDGAPLGLQFRAIKRPKNGPILMKIGIFIQLTSNQKRIKFYQNRTIFDCQTCAIKNWKIIRFWKNLVRFWFEVCWIKVPIFIKTGLFFGPFMALYRELRGVPSQIFDIFFTHSNMKMGWVWKKSVMTIMELILLCRLKFRVWHHAHMGRLRSKIFFTSY